MSAAAAFLADVLDVLERDPEVAARFARAIGASAGQRGAERIPLADAHAHGAPSVRWCSGRGIVRGPRGARYVLASELAAALDASTIARRKTASPPTSTSITDDARAAVVDLAARRKRSA